MTTASLGDAEQRAVPAMPGLAGDGGEAGGVDGGLGVGEPLEGPPPSLVHELPLDVGPARRREFLRPVGAGEEELLVLPHPLAQEVEGGAAAGDGAVEVGGRQDDARLLTQLAHGRFARRLPRVDSPTDREPPQPGGVVDVVTPHEEQPVGGVEQQDARSAAERDAVGPWQPLGTELAGTHRPRTAPRAEAGSSSCGTGGWSTVMPTIASPRPRDTSAFGAASVKFRVACTIAAARLAGSSALKIPEPTNTPSAPSCIIIAASAGVAIPPAVSRATGRRPSLATAATRS